MAVTKDQFQNYISQWADDAGQLVQALETWADNKIDVNPNFDFTAAQTALATAKTNLETSVTTVQAM